MSSMISPSGNYEVQYIKTDELDEHKHKIQFYSRLPLVVFRKIMRRDDGHEIASYKQTIHSTSILEFFFSYVNDDGQVHEWWVSGYWYMHRLFVNCTTGQMFVNPMKIEEGKEDFIWCETTAVTPNGRYLFILGCYWACPYEVEMFRFCPETAEYIYVTFFDDDDLNDLAIMNPLLTDEDACKNFEENKGIGRYWRDSEDDDA